MNMYSLIFLSFIVQIFGPGPLLWTKGVAEGLMAQMAGGRCAIGKWISTIQYDKMTVKVRGTEKEVVQEMFHTKN